MILPVNPMREWHRGHLWDLKDELRHIYSPVFEFTILHTAQYCTDERYYIHEQNDVGCE